MNTVRMTVLFKSGQERKFTVGAEVWEELWETIHSDRMTHDAALMFNKRIIVRVSDVSAFWVDEIANNV